jgi:hypothetical protein
MAPKPGSSRARPTQDDSDTPVTTTQDELETANAEIQRLRAMLEARDQTPLTECSLGPDRLADVLEALTQRLTDERTHKTERIPDPPLLTDGAEPTFENWKLQIRGKLRVNHDHFSSAEARMTYVFSRTGGDAQKHLRPRYADESDDPFATEQEMIAHLVSIYEDPFQTQNARQDYRSLMMETTDTFAEFHTSFLHLAGLAKIPQ